MSEENNNSEATIETTVSSGGNQELISIAPPQWEDEEEEVAIVQEEVSYKDAVFKEVDLGEFQNELMNMVGSDKSVVVTYLEELKANKVVNDFVVRPVGAVHTLEIRPGVVKVLVGSDDTVINIEIS